MIIKTATGYIKSPYNMGDCRILEDFLSVYNMEADEYRPYGYIVHDNALYIPNIDIDRYLKPLDEKEIIKSNPTKWKPMSRHHMSRVAPRDSLQENVISFLTGTGMYKDTKNEHQLAVIVPPGKGKTFTTVYSVTEMNRKSLIITHMVKIKKQWYDTFTGIFDYDPSEIMELTTSALDKAFDGHDFEKNVYFASHQMINRWISSKHPTALTKVLEVLGIGIKVIDEYHLQWRNSLILDMFSNVDKNIYLTATFARSDQGEDMLFKRVTKNFQVYGSDERPEEDKHTIYHPVYYTTKCPFKTVKAMGSGRGMGIKKWIYADWQHFNDPNNTCNNLILDIVDKCLMNDGKILITVASIKAAEFVYEKIQQKYPDLIVGCINSSHSIKDNEYCKQHAQIIVSTVQSIGTGADIKGLRYVINAEPFASKVTAEQFLGRLRPYYDASGEQQTTYLFDFVDRSIIYSTIYHKGRSKRINELVKEVIPLE